MPKRLRKPRQPRDVNQAAHLMVARSTEDKPKISKSEISRIMSAMGAKGGRVSAKRRLEKMTPEQRSNAASALANARWNPKKP